MGAGEAGKASHDQRLPDRVDRAGAADGSAGQRPLSAKRRAAARLVLEISRVSSLGNRLENRRRVRVMVSEEDLAAYERARRALLARMAARRAQVGTAAAGGRHAGWSGATA